MSERPILVLLTLSSLLACGRVTLGTGRDSRGQAGKAGADTVDLGGASGESEVGVSSSGRGGSSDPGKGGMPGGGRGGMGGTLGDSAGSTAIGGGPPGVEPGGQTGIDPLRCAPGLVPMLDGPAGVELPSIPGAGVAADFDGDGKLDLATANLDGSVSVLLGNGDSSLALNETYETGPMRDMSAGPVAIAAADFDGDAELDLLTLQTGSDEVTVQLGRGDGTFAPAISNAMADYPRALAIEDFDHDGSLDLAVAYTESVVVLPGNGDGSLGNAITVFTQSNLTTVGSGDFDEDGRPDLVAIAGDGGLTVLRGDGHGAFEPLPKIACAPGPVAILVADVNEDFHLDAVLMVHCTQGADASAQVVLGAGDGTFAAQESYETKCPAVTAAAYVSGDPFLDLVGGPTNILPGRGNGTFDPVVANPQPMGGNVLAVGDWNGDDVLDLATVVDDVVLVRAGNNDFTFGSLGAVNVPLNDDVSSLVLGDLDDNGTLDMVTASSTTSVVNVLLGTGDGAWSQPLPRPTGGAGGPLLRLGDLNGDRQLDLVTAGNADKSLSVLLGTGTGSFGLPEHYDTPANARALAVADLNGDELPDVVAAYPSPPTLSVLLGLGDGSLAPHRDQSLVDEPWGLAVGDLNGDDQADLVVAGTSNSVSVLTGSGNGRFETPRTYRVAKSSSAVALGDLNGDRVLDIVTANYDSISVLLGNGDGTFGDRTDYPTPVEELALADMNDDGKLDIVTSGFDSEIMLGAGDGTFPCVPHYALGSTTHALAAGELDGDGRVDLVVSTPRPYVFYNPLR